MSLDFNPKKKRLLFGITIYKEFKLILKIHFLLNLNLFFCQPCGYTTICLKKVKFVRVVSKIVVCKYFTVFKVKFF